MRNQLIVWFSVIALSLFNSIFLTIPAYGQISWCGGMSWGLPLERDLKVNSPFNDTKKPKHYGVDYKAVDGDNVLTVADGKISKIDYNLKQLSKPNPRTGQTIQGWGRYVVVKHTDGSQTLYAHLQEGSTSHLSEGQEITKGTMIGKADTTGGATGPHLHLEYSPTGEIFDKDSKVDPHICMTPCPEPPVPLTIAGSETITRNSSAQYTATGCPSNVEWSVSGSGATISSTGLLTVGSTACGSLGVTATCVGCGTSATQAVRVTDAGLWWELARCTAFAGGQTVRVYRGRYLHTLQWMPICYIGRDCLLEDPCNPFYHSICHDTAPSYEKPPLTGVPWYVCASTIACEWCWILSWRTDEWRCP